MLYFPSLTLLSKDILKYQVLTESKFINRVKEELYSTNKISYLRLGL